MATSGTINGSFNGTNAQYLTFRCDWSVISQDTANKTSNVRLRWIVTKTISNLSTYKQNTPWSQTCDGTTTSGSLNFNIGNTSPNTDYVVRDVTVTIAHASNGTKTASINGTLNLSGTSAGTGTFSGSMALPTIATTPPTVSSLTVTDQGTGYSTVGVYVAGFTRFQLTASATATSPATISSYAFYNGTALLASGSASSYTFSSANTAGTYNFKVIVTDSYGNTTTKTASAVTVQPYSMPTIAATTFRCDSSGNADTTGTYARCSMTYSVASVGSNSAQIHKVKVGSLSDVTLTSGTAQVIGGSLSASTTYSAVYTVTDKFGTLATISQVIQSEFVNFDLYPSSTSGGAAFGMVAQSDKFSVNHPSEFLKSVQLDGGIKPDYITSGASSLTALNATLLSEYNALEDNRIGTVIVNPSVAYDPFGGAVTHFVLFRANANYGVIVGYVYTSASGCKFARTSVYGGSITGWETESGGGGGGGAILITKTITENGTYDAASDGANGYSEVVVAIPQTGLPLGVGTGSYTFSSLNLSWSNSAEENV